MRIVISIGSAEALRGRRIAIAQVENAFKPLAIHLARLEETVRGVDELGMARSGDFWRHLWKDFATDLAPRQLTPSAESETTYVVPMFRCWVRLRLHFLAAVAVGPPASALAAVAGTAATAHAANTAHERVRRDIDRASLRNEYGSTRPMLP